MHKHGSKKRSGAPRKRKRDSFLHRYPVGKSEWVAYKQELHKKGEGFKIARIRQLAIIN